MSKDSKSFVSTAGMATVFGIDSHSRTTTICALSRESGETETRTFRGNDYAAMARWMSGFPAPALGVYEAGCTGFVPARRLSAGNVSVVPIAPSKMPASSDSRTRKNDRNDAARLARLAVAGELKEVWVPPCEIEGMRELAHALDDLKARRARAFQHVLALLCRHGVIWDERTPRGALRKHWCVEVKIDFTRLDSEPPPSEPTYIRQSRHRGAPESAATAGEALSCSARSLAL